MIGPQSNSSIHSSLPQRIFQTLSIRYLLALSGIALTILASNWFVKQKLQEQLYDSHLLNVAGQQGMLVQQLVKSTLLLIRSDNSQQPYYRTEITSTLTNWIQSHAFLTQDQPPSQRFNQTSDTIRAMFSSITPFYEVIVLRSRAILHLFEQSIPPPEAVLEEHMTEILIHESRYLQGMKAIVNQYEKEVQQRADQLITMQQFLMYLSLSIILLVIVFVFRPVARFIKKSLLILSQSRAQAKALATERHLLLQSLGESHKYLSNIHFAVEQATLFAKIDRQGALLYISPQFRQQLQLPPYIAPGTIPELLQIPAQELQATLDQVQQQGYCCVDWECADYQARPICLTVTVVPVKNDQGILYQYLFLCIDISEKKEAIHQLHIANQAKIKQKIMEQRMRSVLVLQAQEEERKRIAMDLHDNVGQSLTALKYNVEALTAFATSDRMRQQLDNIGQLLRQTIVKVRQTSFHLMPSILSDYGLAPVLRIFAQEMSHITRIDILFENQDGFDRRLEESIEMNLYRIVQESINNALKYAEATQIRVSLHHNPTTLWITIKDNGIGFEADRKKNASSSRVSGRGIGNMEERANYLQGSFSIVSTPGKGTKIVVQIPLTVQKKLTYGNCDAG